MMKTLLLLVLSMIAIVREATAQDAQCNRERAAMVETIRALARSDASVLGQQGISESPGGHGADETPSVHLRAILLHRIRGQADSDRLRPNHIAAVHRGRDDPVGRGRPR